jgi:hypothetical protein
MNEPQPDYILQVGLGFWAALADSALFSIAAQAEARTHNL